VTKRERGGDRTRDIDRRGGGGGGEGGEGEGGKGRGG